MIQIEKENWEGSGTALSKEIKGESMSDTYWFDNKLPTPRCFD